MAFFLLHPESGHELNAVRIAYAKDAPACGLNCAYIRAGIALRVGGDIGQRSTWRLQEQAAYGGVESVIGQGSGQRNVSGSGTHEGRADSRGVPRCLLNPAGHGGGRQQRRFEVDPGGRSGCNSDLVSAAITNLEGAGKCPLQRKDKTKIGCPS